VKRNTVSTAISAISISGPPCMRGRESVRRLLSAPYFAAGAVRGTTRETSDRYRPLLRTHCEKLERGRCVSADLRNRQELKGIRAENPLRECSVITSCSGGVWRLFDRKPHTWVIVYKLMTEPDVDVKKSRKAQRRREP
jgi:hypothetical protein